MPPCPQAQCPQKAGGYPRRNCSAAIRSRLGPSYRAWKRSQTSARRLRRGKARRSPGPRIGATPPQLSSQPVMKAQRGGSSLVVRASARATPKKRRAEGRSRGALGPAPLMRGTASSPLPATLLGFPIATLTPFDLPCAPSPWQAAAPRLSLAGLLGATPVGRASQPPSHTHKYFNNSSSVLWTPAYGSPGPSYSIE
jgi:hypothetical protein